MNDSIIYPLAIVGSSAIGSIVGIVLGIIVGNVVFEIMDRRRRK